MHKGKRIIITGIPTSGKSHLAKRLAEDFGGKAVFLDDLRENISTDPKYKPWTDFFLNQDEGVYYETSSPQKLWSDLVRQSEGLFPAFVDEINKYQDEDGLVIFECVNLLPSIVKKQFDFELIVLVGKSFDEIFERNKKSPRWGSTEELQRLEAKNFFEVERPEYIREAKEYNCKYFEDGDLAYDYIVNNLLINN